MFHWLNSKSLDDSKELKLVHMIQKNPLLGHKFAGVLETSKPRYMMDKFLLILR